MAATYAHAIIADLLALKISKYGKGIIPKKYQGYIKENTILVQVGALCPDLPYLDEAITGKIPILDADEQKRWGDLMHYVNTGKLILFAVDKLKELKNGEDQLKFKNCLQWFLGFVSHMIVDTVIHPVVENIVGPYVSFEKDHRICEMHQDVWLNKEVYKSDLAQINTIEIVKYFDTPVILEFWKSLLEKCYQFYFLDEEPNFHVWFEDYRQKLTLATGVTSSFGSYHGITYPPYENIDMKKFIHNLETPAGTLNYKEIVDNYMIPNVLRFWGFIIDGIEGKTEEYRNILDFNMDDGKHIRTGAYVSW